MSTRTVRTHVIAIVIGGCAATALQLSAQSPAGADDQIKKLEARIAALERRADSDAPLTVTAPFVVQDRNHKAILRVEGNVKEGADLTLGGSSGASVTLNTSANVAALSVAAEGRPEVHILSADSEAGLSVYKTGTGTRDSSRLFRIAFLGKTDEADGTSAIVTVNNESGDPVAALAATTSGGQVQVGNAEGDATGVELSANADGGKLRVFDKSGEAVGGLFGSAKGGGLALTGPGGGFSAVSLGINKGGGSVRVFSATGGSARAALEADAATGGVTAYDQQGKPAATLTSGTGGSGILQLLSEGTTMVEAGTSQDGVGLVRAGPATRGVIGTVIPPHTLMGRKQD